MSQLRPTNPPPPQSRISITVLGDPTTIDRIKLQLAWLKQFSGRSIQHLVLEALTDLIAKHQVSQTNESNPS